MIGGVGDEKSIQIPKEEPKGAVEKVGTLPSREELMARLEDYSAEDKQEDQERVGGFLSGITPGNTVMGGLKLGSLAIGSCLLVLSTVVNVGGIVAGISGGATFGLSFGGPLGGVLGGILGGIFGVVVGCIVSKALESIGSLFLRLGSEKNWLLRDSITRASQFGGGMLFNKG